MNGILLVDKPAGLSSHAVVARVRRSLNRKRVGHAGTLDPMATGLLVVGVDAGTRLLTFLVGADKSYAATIRLGIGTDTDDATGTILATPGYEQVDLIEASLAPFRGAIRQRPSAVSAIKVAGRRSYQRVRAGEAVELAERPVTVHSLDLIEARRTTDPDTGLPVVDVDVVMAVSSGTYVRAIARDLGAGLDSAGHLTALRRTAVGPFDVRDAGALADVAADTPLHPLGDIARRILPALSVSPDHVDAVSHGVRLPCDTAAAGPVALLSPTGELLAVSSCGDDARWRHQFVVPQSPSDTLRTP